MQNRKDHIVRYQVEETYDKKEGWFLNPSLISFLFDSAEPFYHSVEATALRNNIY